MGGTVPDRSWRLRVAYSAVLLTAYFGLFLACAFSPSAMARPISSGPVTVSMALAAAMMIGSVAIAGLYALATRKG
jgi:uncharacterized membrane protein (DUF485 family)